jgi:hypothetical protein
MFLNETDREAYVITNYPEVTDSRIDDDHWDLLCTHCKVVRGFQVLKHDLNGYWSRRYSENEFFRPDYKAPHTYWFRCPVCKAHKLWIVFVVELEHEDTGDKKRAHYYRVTSIPGEGLEDIDELPAEPPSLRIAYRQAIRAMDANAHLAAAAMFRRAVQIITRDLLKAKPGNLANELNEVVGKPFNGGVVTSDFAKVGYIIKEAGNQGAHPDRDPDLLDFTQDDSVDLQRIFMELISELFVVPAASRKAREDFLARRKIAPVPGNLRPKPDQPAGNSG